MKKFFIFVILLIVLPLGYCTFIWPHFSWNQKMTIVVEIDGQIYSGSSVTSVWWRENDSFSSQQGPNWVSAAKGEAVVVKLPDNKYLFALLSYSGNTEYTANLATRILFESKQRVWGSDKFRAVLAVKSGPPLDVPHENYPLLVTFKYINDPSSVQKVNLGDLAASLGAGAELKSLTLEITDEPVSKGRVKRVLGWWGNLTVPIGGNIKRKYGEPLYGLGKWSFVKE